MCRKIGEIGGDAFNSLVELLREGHISVNVSHLQQQKKLSQKTLAGTTASARAAKYPAIELYDRLGLQHCLPDAMRSKFIESSVHEINDRRRAYLIRVSTPLVKVGDRLLAHETLTLKLHPTHTNRRYSSV